MINRTKLVTDNLNLVKKIAHRYLRQMNRDTVIGFEDVFSEGCVGLVKAAKSFDPTRGYEFSTYAYHMIAGYIQKFLNQRGTLIRFPVRTVSIAREIFREGLEDEPIDVLAKRFGRHRVVIKDALAYIKQTSRVSLDYQLTDDDDEYTFYSLTPSYDDETAVIVKAFLDGLKPKHRIVAELMIEGYTQREISQILGVGYRTVNQRVAVIRDELTKFYKKAAA